MYHISDPTNIAKRGYINPATGYPYSTSQPFASFLSKAMADCFEHSTATKRGDAIWKDNKYDPKVREFYKQVVEHKYKDKYNAKYHNRNSAASW